MGEESGILHQLQDELDEFLARAATVLPANDLDQLLRCGRLRMAKVETSNRPSTNASDVGIDAAPLNVEPPDSDPRWDNVAFCLRQFLRTGRRRI